MPVKCGEGCIGGPPSCETGIMEESCGAGDDERSSPLIVEMGECNALNVVDDRD